MSLQPCPVCGAAEPAPLFATARTPSRRTHGGAIAAIAAAMGKPLMPWQRLVADVSTEVLEDGSWAYPDVAVQVQRQAGKTTLMGPRAVELCMVTPGAMTWFTQQTRQDARDTLVEGYMPQVKVGPLAGRVKPRLSNGSEGLYFPGSSFFRVFAPTGDALHGKANRLVIVDEVWAFDAERGLELEQAITPTFTTTGGQKYLVSAGGTAASAWLKSWVDRGRAAVRNGRRRGLAYFEFGVPADHREELERLLTAGKEALQAEGGLEDGADLPAELVRGLAIVLAHHPAAGYTLRQDALAAAAESMKVGEFLRAYANIWTETDERVIPAHAWDAGRPDAWPAPATRVAFGFDVSLDGKSAAITASWRDDPAGPMRWDVAWMGPPAELVPQLVDLATRRKPVAIAHAGGTTLDTAAQLSLQLPRRQAESLVLVNGRDYYAACQGTLGAVLAGRLEHNGQAALDMAVAGAGRRFVGDGAWLWWRNESAGSIAPLVAGTAAGWAFDHPPAKQLAKPKVYAGRGEAAAFE